jgi:hypothetical protein
MFNQGSKKIIASETKDVKKFNYKTEMSARDTEIKIKSSLNRANLFKKNFMYLSDKGYKQRKAFFCHPTAGYFSQTFENPQIDLFNPNMSFEMIKKTVLNGLNYGIIFLGGGYFFSGFILLKLPFGLTQKFRSMTQQGLNLPDVDVSYVSAISWCAILMFGINSIIQFFDGGEEFSMLNQQMAMNNPMAAMQNMGGFSKDFNKMVKPEKESINILPHFSVLDDAVDKFIEKYQKLV